MTSFDPGTQEGNRCPFPSNPEQPCHPRGDTCNHPPGHRSHRRGVLFSEQPRFRHAVTGEPPRVCSCQTYTDRATHNVSEHLLSPGLSPPLCPGTRSTQNSSTAGRCAESVTRFSS